MSECAKNISKWCGTDFEEIWYNTTNKSTAKRQAVNDSEALPDPAPVNKFVEEITLCNGDMENTLTDAGTDAKKCTTRDDIDCQCISETDDKMQLFKEDCFSENNTGKPLPFVLSYSFPCLKGLIWERSEEQKITSSSCFFGGGATCLFTRLESLAWSQQGF